VTLESSLCCRLWGLRNARASQEVACLWALEELVKQHRLTNEHHTAWALSIRCQVTADHSHLLTHSALSLGFPEHSSPCQEEETLHYQVWMRGTATWASTENASF
jgi:hypothetical protein